MNILISSLHFYPEIFRINDIAQYLSKNGKNNIYILTGLPNYPKGKLYKDYENKSLKWKNEHHIKEIVRVPIILRGNGSSLRIILNYLSFILMAPIYGFFLFRKKKINVILTYATSPIFQSIPTIILGKIFNCTTFLWVQDLWPDNLVYIKNVKNKFFLRCLNLLVSKIYNLNNILIAQSNSYKKIIKDRSNYKKVFFIPQPGPTLNKINYKKNNKNTNKKKIQILYFGNIGKAQSIETLIETSVKLQSLNKKILIKCIGEGSEKKRLIKIKKIKKLNNLKIMSYKHRKELDKIIMQSDALLITMKKGYGFESVIPGRLIHYFMTGLPIIGAADGEVSRAINKSKSGFCTNSENSMRLSELIVKFSNMSERKIKNLQVNSLKYYKKNFDINIVGEKFIKLFRKYSKEN
tara:strand:- start:59 stop:1282 length:1224 start_codon:yes stop_codon:yes gene_type:complete